MACTLAEYESECVARGATYLDDKSPGWARNIHLFRLKMASCQNCVLGQMFLDYTEGLKAIGLYATEDNAPHRYGFTIAPIDVRWSFPDGGNHTTAAREWDRLGVLWAEQVRARTTTP